MAVEENIKFSFTSTSQADDTFTVAEFSGTETVSKLYRFDITLYADDPEIDLKEVLKNPVQLMVEKDGEVLRRFHGILSRFEQLHEYSGHVYFRAVLVPRLWIADQFQENQLFLDKKVPDIIEEVLKQAGLTSIDYELKLTGGYRPWEYICQYNETDFNFISRWMEREGIYYYFEQGQDAEKLIITDSSTAHEDIASSDSIRYSPPDSLSPSSMHQVREFTCHQQLLPKKVVLKDYNYRKPSLDLKGEADVDPEGRGKVYIYGEHFKTPEEGNDLAGIRAGELLCREALFFGEGTVPSFLTGYIFEMHDHYRDSYNQRYLITELTHQGVQSTYLTGAGGATPGTENQGPAYFNNFSCIPAEVQFRPERLAEKTRLDGTLNATIDASGDGQYAEIDDQGRYKVKLPFDQSDAADGKASSWVRMTQPYAGADYGMHFPLHKGTEVLLTFVDGNPDRPIIAGAVPNPETGSPVKGDNQTQSVIKSGGGNQLHMGDQQGEEEVSLFATKDMNTTVSNDQTNTINNNRTSSVAVDDSESVGSNQVISIGADQKTTVGANQNFDVGANQVTGIGANQIVSVGANQNYTVGANQGATVGANQTVTVGSAQTNNVGSNRASSVGGNDELTVSGAQAITVSGDIAITSSGKITLDGGGSKIEISGGGVVIESAGPVTVMGSVIKLN
ncbi:MAG: type VI secretion system tip protein TssI/VgrG [Candidatus Electrothrix communis]|nr:MAG: type VI secretion system tip protein TssI/VgrG [Candidatus Electrothrix communis]